MKKGFTLVLLVISFTVFSQTQDSSFYYFQQGVQEKTAKRYLVATNHFERAIQLNPVYSPAYIENGYVNMEMRRIDVAKENFIKAYELDNENSSAIRELMELYFNYKQYKKAIDFANRCRSCENAERIIALSYYKMEDYAKAEKILLSIIEKDPANAEMTYTAARNYLEMELEAKAIPYYEKAVQLDDTKSSWFFELGLLYYNNTNFKKAVEYFNKAAEKGFNQSNDFIENLGFAYLYTGEFEKGEKLLLDISARKPGDKDLLRDIAQAYYDSKLYDKSLEFCQKLLEMDMKDGKALYQAGLCFQKKGQKQRGQQMCDRAIELDPSLGKLRQNNMSVGL